MSKSMTGMLTLLFALLVNLAAVRAVRQTDAAWELEEETGPKPDQIKLGQSTPDQIEEEQEDPSVPDAVSQPCTFADDSIVFKHMRLGSYSPQEIMDGRCDEPRLVLLARELSRMQNMEHTIDIKDFRKKFPEEFTLDARNRQLVVSAVLTSLRAVSAVPADVIHNVDTGLLVSESVVSYSLYVKSQLQEDIAQPEKQIKQMVEKGAKGITPFWQDVTMGALEDVFRVVFSTWRTVAHGGDPITLQKVAMFEQPNNEKPHLQELAALQTLQFADVAIEVAQQSSPKAEVTKLENPERLFANGYVLMSIGGELGWVDAEAIAPWGWLTYGGSSKLAVCWTPQLKCSNKDEIVGYIHPGQTFKVESFQDYWLLVGQGGYIPKVTKGLTGPLSAQDAWEAEAETWNELSLENKAIKDYRVISSFNKVWKSGGVKTSKFLVGIAIAIGGIITHGLGFLIAGIVFGVSTTGTDAALAVKITEQVLSQVTYTQLALLQFERELVSGTTDHELCDIKQGTLCPSGFVCMREMVFLYRDMNDHHWGWCVRSPYNDLQGNGQSCAVDMDCASGVCDLLNTEGNLKEKLLGTCTG